MKYRNFILQKHHKFLFKGKGSIKSSALLLADVDQDECNEFVIGNTLGTLNVYKFTEVTAAYTSINLGAISCLTFGQVGKNPKFPFLIVVSTEGECHFFNVKLQELLESTPNSGKNKKSSDQDKNTPIPEQKEAKLLVPLKTFRVPCNITAISLIDLDKDGDFLLFLGSSDRHVYMFQLNSSSPNSPSSSPIVFPTFQNHLENQVEKQQTEESLEFLKQFKRSSLINLKKWFLPKQIFSFSKHSFTDFSQSKNGEKKVKDVLLIGMVGAIGYFICSRQPDQNQKPAAATDGEKNENAVKRELIMRKREQIKKFAMNNLGAPNLSNTLTDTSSIIDNPFFLDIHESEIDHSFADFDYGDMPIYALGGVSFFPKNEKITSKTQENPSDEKQSDLKETEESAVCFVFMDGKIDAKQPFISSTNNQNASQMAAKKNNTFSNQNLNSNSSSGTYQKKVFQADLKCEVLEPFHINVTGEEKTQQLVLATWDGTTFITDHTQNLLVFNLKQRIEGFCVGKYHIKPLTAKENKDLEAKICFFYIPFMNDEILCFWNDSGPFTSVISRNLLSMLEEEKCNELQKERMENSEENNENSLWRNIEIEFESLIKSPSLIHSVLYKCDFSDEELDDIIALHSSGQK